MSAIMFGNMATTTAVAPILAGSRRAELTEQRDALVSYLLSKVRAADWHAVQDAGSDIREIDARLDELSRV